MRRLLFAIALIALCLGKACGQGLAQDTLAFRQLLSDKMWKYYSMQTLATLYDCLYYGPRQPVAARSDTSDVLSALVSGSHDSGLTYAAAKARSDKFFQHQEKRSYPEGKLVMDWLTDLDGHIRQLDREADAYRASYTDKSAEKRRLVQALAAFDTAAVNKPVFFSEIYGKFKGNIGKYVDHLYKRSILCNQRRMDTFRVYPKKAEDFQKDPGVQFVIGMALYELWIKDVREGRVVERQ